MAAAFIVLENEGRRGPEHIIRDYSNPLESLSDQDVVDAYRLSPNLIYNLCDTLEHELKGKPVLK